MQTLSASLPVFRLGCLMREVGLSQSACARSPLDSLTCDPRSAWNWRLCNSTTRQAVDAIRVARRIRTYGCLTIAFGGSVGARPGAVAARVVAGELDRTTQGPRRSGIKPWDVHVTTRAVR